MRKVAVSLLAFGVVATVTNTSARGTLPADLVLYASDASLNGAWQRVTDASAAGGVRVWQPDAGAAKITTPSGTPRDYFDIAFQAEAGRPYRLWIRSQAQNNSYNNDSVYVQFSGAVDENNQPIFRMGTPQATTVVLENCGGCGVAAWGWQDNEYGGLALGPEIRFAQTGPQTLRIQAREDGISIDQIVLSSAAFFSTPPGAFKNDTTVIPRTTFPTTTAAASSVAFTELRYAATLGDIGQAADMNGDGRPDVVGLFDSEPILLRTAVNAGTRTFRSGPEVEAGSGGALGAVAMAIRDYNNDGRKDVLFLDRWFRQLVAVPGDGTGAFGASVFTTFGETPGDFAAADFNGDGKVDVVVTEPERNAVTLYLGDGAGHFTFVAFGTTTGEPSRVAAADIDGDGRTDVAVVCRTIDTVSLFYGDGTGRFRAQGSLLVPGAPRAVAIADVTGDGHTDVVVSNSSGVSVYAAVGAGGDWEPRRDLRATATRTGFPLDGGLAVADVNGDGLADLIVDHTHNDPRSGGWNSVSVLYGLGRGSFSAPDEFSKDNVNQAPVSVADVDGDGRADLVQPDSNRGFTVLWNAASTSNHAPVARAGADVSVGVSQQSNLILSSTSSDPDGHLLEHSWRDSSGNELSIGQFARPFRDVQRPAGTYAFTLTVNDLHGGTATDSVTVTLVNDAPGGNTAPVAHANASLAGVWRYEQQFQDEPDPATALFSTSTDADGDPLSYEWRDESGQLLGTAAAIDHPRIAPGTHTITLTVRDGRGGVSSDSLTLVVKPYEEIYISGGYKEQAVGAWQRVEIPADSGGPIRTVVQNADAGAAKVTTPLASPTSFAQFSFVADPSVEYKLWIRLKAQNNYFGNDSVWVQFTGSTDSAGNPKFRAGTTSGLEVVLEECSGCGLSEWGWRDDAWGARGIAPSATYVRFPAGGIQTIRIQTREDGAAVDQVVLSARKYKTTRPGAVKNDTTILQFTAFWGT